MIQLTNVSKRYENGVVALNDINLRIEQGEFAYLVGPSGFGKSTLMKILYREEIQTQGKVVVGKYHLNRLKPKDVPMLRRQVGVIFQDFKLLPSLTAYENVAYAMEVTGKSRKEIKKRVKEVMELVGLQTQSKPISKRVYQVGSNSEYRLHVRLLITHVFSLPMSQPETWTLRMQLRYLDYSNALTRMEPLFSWEHIMTIWLMNLSTA